ncbi:MAG: hypothetical protein ACPGU1_10065 [Myxococcota bacterium]
MIRPFLLSLLIALIVTSGCATTQITSGEGASALSLEHLEHTAQTHTSGSKLRLTIVHQRIGDAFEGDTEVPQTRITALEGAPEDPTGTTLVGDVTGTCDARHDVDDPERTLLHLVCWYAGGGREVAVTRSGGELRVETRVIWEEDEEDAPWQLKQSIPWHTGLELDVRALHVP